jgi:hypothetical protein
MAVSRLEALADAIAHYSGWTNPESEAYQARNPGALPAISSKHIRNAKGQRVFRSMLDGYQALLFDLAIKCSGHSHTRLKPISTLRELMLAYHQPDTTGKFVAKYLKRALQDEQISENTPLRYFVEEI